MNISRSTIFVVFKTATIILAGILWVAVMKWGHFGEGKEMSGKIFVALTCLGMVAIPFILEIHFKKWDKIRDRKKGEGK